MGNMMTDRDRPWDFGPSCGFTTRLVDQRLLWSGREGRSHRATRMKGPGFTDVYSKCKGKSAMSHSCYMHVCIWRYVIIDHDQLSCFCPGVHCSILTIFSPFSSHFIPFLLRSVGFQKCPKKSPYLGLSVVMGLPQTLSSSYRTMGISLTKTIQRFLGVPHVWKPPYLNVPYNICWLLSFSSQNQIHGPYLQMISPIFFLRKSYIDFPSSSPSAGIP